MGAPRRLTFALAVLFALPAAACSKAPEDGQCDKLMDHLVELKLVEAKVSADKAPESRKSLHEAMDAKFKKRCETELRASQVQCALKAKDRAGLDACDS